MEKKETKKKLENQIQNEILAYLEQNKGHYFFWRSNNIPVFAKNNAGKYMYRKLPKHTPKGIPDIMVIFHGKFIAIEVKREGEKLSEDQAIFGENITLHRAIYYVVHSLDELKALFPFRLHN